MLKCQCNTVAIGNPNHLIIIFLLMVSLLWVKPVAAADELTTLLTGGNAPTEETTTDKVITTDNTDKDDKQIKSRLQEIFSELDNFQQVGLDVSSGVVKLSGQVESQANAERAVQLANQVEGVVAVKNELTVNRSLQTRLDTTRQKILDTFNNIVANLPLFALALVVFTVFWFIGGWLSKRHNFYQKFTRSYFIASLLGQIVHLLLIILGLVLALALLDATALLGTILGAAGIFGLAIGFAVKDTVENYIASILLSLRNPFEINDLVNIDGQEGNVMRLDSRATMLISPDGNHIRIPNALVFKAVITNFSRHAERRFQFDVGVDTDQDLLYVQGLALETLTRLPGVLSEPAPMVLIQELGDSNVILRLFAWVNQTSHNLGKVRSEAIRQVKQRFDEAGVVIPEPIYKLRLMQDGGGETQTASASHATPLATRADKPSMSTQRAVKDISADHTIEKKVEAEQQVNEDENLLKTTTNEGDSEAKK